MIGDMMSLLYAASNLTRYVKNILANMMNILANMMEIYDNMVFIENLQNFLRQKPNIEINRDGEVPEQTNCFLQINNVSFCYKNREKYALHNISIEIPHDSKIAIVGPNGSGKSTLIKLIKAL